jgi:HD-GYP domain-containing protein (c-di-GMP phosphodiesterase class II)
MSYSTELFSGHGDPRGLRSHAAALPPSGAPAVWSVWSSLPLAVLTTALVIVLPAVIVGVVVPEGGVPLMIASASAAVTLSTIIAGVGSALWKRRPQSRDVIFSDLMLWGLLRRWRTERRLSRTRELYESARRAGATVDIDLMTALNELLEARDSYTHGHGRRVARYARRVADVMHVPALDVARISAAAAVHDIGKLHTPRAILNNPGRLSNQEFAVIKRHPADGADMLAAIGDPEIAAMVRHHHERLDGHGYPDGLVGSEIPLGARIIAVADTFDAITSSRAYRSAGTHKRALDILRKEAGSQLDAAAVAAFVSCYSSRRAIACFALAVSIPQRIVEALRTIPSAVSLSSSGVAAVLPAVGAAGVLTLSHAASASRHLQSRQVIPTAVVRQVTLTSRQAPTKRSRAHSTAPHSSKPRPGRHVNQTLLQPHIHTTPAAPGSNGIIASSVVVQESSEPEVVVTTPTTPPNEGAPSPEPPVSTPIPPTTPPSAPTVSTPSATTPSITTPSVTTPSVTLSSVGISGTTVPSVTVPSVTIPKIEVRIPALL